MAAMAVGIDQKQLQENLTLLAQGFQAEMDSSAVPGGRSQADKMKGQALASLSNNFNLGCGMLAAFSQDDPLLVANEISGQAGSTINKWYDPDIAMSGFGMVSVVEGCNIVSGGGKKKKGRYIQKGGNMPDRYDVFTIILIGATGAGAIYSFGGQALSMVMGAADFIIQHAVDYAVKLGLFKPQCDGPSGTAWNLFKQYTVGQLVPVETCADKIRYNDAQVLAIKGSLGVLAGLLAPLTAYFTKDFMASGAKGVYNAIKTRISVPVVDAIMSVINRGAEQVCSLASRSSQAIMYRGQVKQNAQATGQAPPAPSAEEREATEQAAMAAADEESRAIATVTDQLKTEMAKVGDNITPETAEQILALLKNGASGGARRRRKRATRKGKGRKGKKSKTAKRGRKSKSVRKVKGRKAKKGKKTRRGTRRGIRRGTRRGRK
jgi:hypothetical protein